MSTSAPNSRLVDALTGEKAPDEFFDALAELDELHSLRTRVAELEGALKLAGQDLAHADVLMGRLIAERDTLRSDWARAEYLRAGVQNELAAVTEERDNLASDLVDLREAHAVTIRKLAIANAGLARIERSGW